MRPPEKRDNWYNTFSIGFHKHTADKRASEKLILNSVYARQSLRRPAKSKHGSLEKGNKVVKVIISSWKNLDESNK